MITRKQAQNALHAFTWCDLLEFMECYEIAHANMKSAWAITLTNNLT